MKYHKEYEHYRRQLGLHHKNLKPGALLSAYHKKHKMGFPMQDALKSGNYHQRAQKFITSAKQHGFNVTAENTGELNASKPRFKKHKLAATIGKSVKSSLGRVGQIAKGTGQVVGGAATSLSSPYAGAATKSVFNYGKDMVKSGVKNIIGHKKHKIGQIGTGIGKKASFGKVQMIAPLKLRTERAYPPFNKKKKLALNQSDLNAWSHYDKLGNKIQKTVLEPRGSNPKAAEKKRYIQNQRDLEQNVHDNTIAANTPFNIIARGMKTIIPPDILVKRKKR